MGVSVVDFLAHCQINQSKPTPLIPTGPTGANGHAERPDHWLCLAERQDQRNHGQ